MHFAVQTHYISVTCWRWDLLREFVKAALFNSVPEKHSPAKCLVHVSVCVCVCNAKNDFHKAHSHQERNYNDDDIIIHKGVQCHSV